MIKENYWVKNELDLQFYYQRGNTIVTQFFFKHRQILWIHMYATTSYKFLPEKPLWCLQWVLCSFMMHKYIVTKVFYILYYINFLTTNRQSVSILEADQVCQFIATGLANNLPVNILQSYTPGFDYENSVAFPLLVFPAGPFAPNHREIPDGKIILF